MFISVHPWFNCIVPAEAGSAPAGMIVGYGTGNVAMNRYEFELHLSPERFLDYYRGTVRQIVVRCTTGQNVQFPASLLQKHVTAEGIHGRFVLSCDERNKCLGLERVTDKR